MKTLILGASDNPERYAYQALRLLRHYEHEVVAIGNRTAKVLDVAIHNTPQNTGGIDTITIYLRPDRQTAYYDYILSLQPRRIIFNPGAENAELEQKAQQNGIKTENACTLVLLRTGQY
ncbi:MAG: CoA-binding protein [Sphingobacteriales bacterium]|nr:CoA-binding protein [Sphingobacteriales bacterium]